MGTLISFFLAGPARVQALLGGAAVLALGVAVLLTFGLWWRGEAYQARGERDVAIAQARVLSGSLQACNAGVDQAKAAGDRALADMAELLAKARKVAGKRVRVIERIEKIIHEPAKPGEDCNWAWERLEGEHRMPQGRSP